VNLANSLMPLFAQLRAFAQQPSGGVAELAAQLDDAIAAARRAAHDAGYCEADVDEALFAVTAWADEVLLASPWEGAAHWQRHLLQRRYFNVANAGVVFFERLDRLTPEQLPVREVYTLCLGMGFGGRYAYDRNQKVLMNIKRANLASLLQGSAGAPGGAGKLLFPGSNSALPTHAGDNDSAVLPARLRHRLSWRLVAALVFPVALLLALFGFFDHVVGESVGALLTQIQA